MAGPIHDGADVDWFKMDQLQEWVNVYYNFPWKETKIGRNERMVCGFLLYIAYVRFHPHSDGNGRIARYLFLENKRLSGTPGYFPLSSMLVSSPKVRAAHEALLRQFGSRSDMTQLIDFQTFEVTHRTVRSIIDIAYTSVVFKCILCFDKELLQLAANLGYSADDFVSTTRMADIEGGHTIAWSRRGPRPARQLQLDDFAVRWSALVGLAHESALSYLVDPASAV
jgi:hypothetical protein